MPCCPQPWTGPREPSGRSLWSSTGRPAPLGPEPIGQLAPGASRTRMPTDLSRRHRPPLGRIELASGRQLGKVAPRTDPPRGVRRLTLRQNARQQPRLIQGGYRRLCPGARSHISRGQALLSLPSLTGTSGRIAFAVMDLELVLDPLDRVRQCLGHRLEPKLFSTLATRFDNEVSSSWRPIRLSILISLPPSLRDSLPSALALSRAAADGMTG